MGEVSIAEGLADNQTDMWKLRAQSIQAEMEKVIENDIFRRVLQANGIDAHVEFEWGEPSDKERNEELARLNELLKLPVLTEELRNQIEFQIADLLKIDRSLIEDSQEQREREETEPQPKVPGSNEAAFILFDKKIFTKQSSARGWAKRKGFDIAKETLAIETPDAFKFQLRPMKDFMPASFTHQQLSSGMGIVMAEVKGESEDHYGRSMAIQEWLGFNYTDYIEDIIEFVDADEFAVLSQSTSASQVSSIKQILKRNFKSGKSIRDIEGEISELGLSDLVDDEGNIRVAASRRSLMIARTESTRIAAEGSLKHYGKGGCRIGSVGCISWPAN